jgi:hypothetical protein
MSRQNMASPISVLVAGVVVVVMLLMGSSPHTSATASLQGTTYPPKTATAMTAQAYFGPTWTAEALTRTPTRTGTSGTATTTATGTPQITGTVTIGTATPTEPVGMFENTPTVEELATPTDTPTATPSSALTCAPGSPLEIGGEGPPRAAYLIYFGERAVGGGTIEADGTFVARLVMGLERAGVYDVTVRLRGTRQVLRELSCTVPAVTPTPIPRERDFR